MAKKEPGWWWAQGSLVAGIGISIYGNVQHTVLAPKHHGVGAVLFAMCWPVLLFLSIELMAKARWPHGNLWALARFGGLGVVALVGAVASYDHLLALLAYYSEDALVAHIGPLAPDGLMVMATTALLGMSRKRPAESAADSLPEPAEGTELAELPVPVLEAPSASNGHGQLTAVDDAPKRAASVRAKDRARSARARKAYRDSVSVADADPTGETKPLNGKQLGTRFRLSEEWGRARIREAKQEAVTV